jgi:hypothetical protein
MAYPVTIPAFVDIDEGQKVAALMQVCTYVNQINAQQSAGNTFAIAVPDQSSAEATTPPSGLTYINACINAMNACNTRAALAVPNATPYLSLDYSGFQPALNVALLHATAVKVALGG